jgi:hypothetical protein
MAYLRRSVNTKYARPTHLEEFYRLPRMASVKTIYVENVETPGRKLTGELSAIMRDSPMQ